MAIQRREQRDQAREWRVYAMGNFVVVRGLSDRYVRTALNGAEIPSLDPKRSSVSMDLFPTNLVDNLVVVKDTEREPAVQLLRGIHQRTHEGFSGQLYVELFHVSRDSIRMLRSTRTSSPATAGNTASLGLGQRQRSTFQAACEIRDPIASPQYSNYYDALVLAGFGDELNELGVNSTEDIGTGSRDQTSITNIVNSIEGIDNLSQVNDEFMPAIREQQNQDCFLSRRRPSAIRGSPPSELAAPLNLSKSIAFRRRDSRCLGAPLGYNFGFAVQNGQ